MLPQGDTMCKKPLLYLWLRRVFLSPVFMFGILAGIPMCYMTVGIDAGEFKPMVRDMFHFWWRNDTPLKEKTKC